MESFWATLKAECATAVFATREIARNTIFDYIFTFYKQYLSQWGCLNLSPSARIKRQTSRIGVLEYRRSVPNAAKGQKLNRVRAQAEGFLRFRPNNAALGSGL